jgi:murein DD-endopeptidase MepM/ murein hydrolase activator NlpD
MIFKKNSGGLSFLLFLLSLLFLFSPEQPVFAMDWSQIEWDNKPLITIKLHGMPRNIAASYDRNPGTPRAAISSGDMDAKISKNDGARTAASSADIAAVPSSAKLKLPGAVPPVISPAVPPRAPAARPAAASGKMRWPVAGRVSSGYGKRGRRMHMGIDIPKAKGSPIRAAQDGTVADISDTKDGRLRGYGNVVILRHSRQMTTWYAHCDTIKVAKGQSVKKGDVIGFVGKTGRATANLLHFEVRRANKPLNPLNFLGEI